MTKKTTIIVFIFGMLSFIGFFVFIGLSQEYKGWVIPTIVAFGGFVGMIALIGTKGETKK